MSCFFRVVVTLLLFTACARAAEPAFDSTTGILTLPSVRVGAAVFTDVTLLNLGNFTFKLQTATPGVAGGSSSAVYDEGTGVLEIASVLVNDSAYRVSLQNTGNYAFTLTSAVLVEPDTVTLAPESVYGTYRRLPFMNDWHVGTIGPKPGTDQTMMQWRNQANVTWNLLPELTQRLLRTDDTNPYATVGIPNFNLVVQDGAVVAFMFNGDLYQRDGAPAAILQTSGGLHGYISATFQQAPAQYSYGFSFYTSVWPLLDTHLAGFSVGLPGTWITPDNNTFTQPLLPLGAGTIRESAPERAATYWRDVFQTIEGGSGYWANLHFPAATPKFRINGTPDGYRTQLTTPGWAWGNAGALERSQMGLAQLSNRLLLAPDGVTYAPETNGEILGVAWMALPLTTARTGSDGTTTGEHAWTLFLNTENFKGAVAFWIPDVWARLSKSYAVINGRGLDTRPALMRAGAMEFNTVPQFQSNAANGTKYSKVPRLSFPVGDGGVTYLMQDVRTYARASLADSMRAWLENGTPSDGHFGNRSTFTPAMQANPVVFTQSAADGSRMPIDELDQIMQTAVVPTPGSSAFVLVWSGNGTPGLFPEYYRNDGESLVPLAASELPDDTRLASLDFLPATDGQPYTSPAHAADAWSSPGPAAGPFTANLEDGTALTYYWYRFIDQPSLQTLNWNETEKTRLQTLIEAIHRDWQTTGDYMAPPSRGTLITIDPGNLVTPPPGLGAGYVPVVVRQQKR